MTSGQLALDITHAVIVPPHVDPASELTRIRAAVREIHKSHDGICAACLLPWPCDTSRIIDEGATP